MFIPLKGINANVIKTPKLIISSLENIIFLLIFNNIVSPEVNTGYNAITNKK